MANRNPIGIFDSGVGGLSIALRVREILPKENLLYVADSAHAPYGDKAESYIVERSSLLIQFLLKKKVKAIVVACNTATVSSIQKLRSEYAIPIIGVEPGVKPAALTSKSGVVGVLATEQTLNSFSFISLMRRFSTNVKIEIQPCPGLVERVEKMNFYGYETEELIKQYVLPLLEKGADNIVLGCTHYAFLAPAIQKIVGSEVGIINTDIAVANEVARRLDSEKLLSTSKLCGREEFWSSGVQSVACQQFSKLWGKPVNVQKM